MPRSSYGDAGLQALAAADLRPAGSSVAGREPLQLSSVAFAEGEPLPERLSRSGGNVSPPLNWSAVPSVTAELAILCHDPDAPQRPFVHWVISGIAPSTVGVAEGSDPATSVAGRNDFGEAGWGGPDPPVGDGPHRYVFTLFATGRPLQGRPEWTGGDLLSALDRRVVARAQLVGTYERRGFQA